MGEQDKRDLVDSKLPDPEVAGVRVGLEVYTQSCMSNQSNVLTIRFTIIA
jgi:hypothetical protein